MQRNKSFQVMFKFAKSIVTCFIQQRNLNKLQTQIGEVEAIHRPEYSEILW